METGVLIAVVLAAIVIIALGLYAGKLLFLVKAQSTKQQAIRNKRIASIQDSIQTIAFAMQQQQCDLSEGVIRICYLLEALPVSPHPDYPAIYPKVHALFEKVKNYPTHEARAQLSKGERRAQDKEREQFESELESAILKETEALRHFQA